MCSILAQAMVTEYHRLCGLNNKQLFLTVLGAGRPRAGCQHGWLLVKARCWWGLKTVYSYVYSHGREWASPLASYKAVIPHVSPPSWRHYLPKAHLQILSQWSKGFSIWSLGDTNVRSTASRKNKNPFKISNGTSQICICHIGWFYGNENRNSIMGVFQLAILVTEMYTCAAVLMIQSWPWQTSCSLSLAKL